MAKPIHVYEVLRRPIVTEKSTLLAGHGKYVFEVSKDANKPQIAAAVERAFNVKVADVNTAIVRGRRPRNRYGRRTGTPPSWKKAIVTLKDGDQIQLFEGV
jgi:large subunit ribosomal protein L23